MKVLIITPYVACNKVEGLSRHKGGFGYMVYDIASAISRKEDVYIYTTHLRHEGFCVDNISFIETSFQRFIFRSLNYLNCLPLVSIFKRYRLPLREIACLLYNTIQLGYLKEIIQKGCFDIVHIHGWEFNNEQIISLCKKLNQPYMITLHGLNSISEAIKIDQACKKNEQDFIIFSSLNNIPMSVISSGIKKSMSCICNGADMSNVRVIGNAFSFGDNKKDIDIRRIYQIPKGAKILLYVGNITYNKNQEQMVEAFDLMDQSVCSNTYVLFLGRNIEPGYSIVEKIQKSNYSEHLILCGNIDKEEIYNYYKECSGVVLLSHAEGFGLSLIEGMNFGKPCACFTDIDAYFDIFNPNVMIGIEKRTNNEVAKQIELLLSKKWDEKIIKEYSAKFSLNSMADNYINYYKDIIYGRQNG